MKKGIIIAVSAIVIIGVAAYIAMYSHKATPQNNAPTSHALTSDSMNPEVTVTATDDNADHTTISIKKGASVKLTFKVSQDGVYHGGLQFKSTDPAIDSGPIAPGKTKTITFTANKSFSFQPYWYASGVKKDYLITINVQ
jgi:archaellum component FlaF (FlaF/FlaG flagellin family)